MKLKSINKKLTLASVGLLSTTLLLSSVITVNYAATSTTGTIIINTKNATPNMSTTTNNDGTNIDRGSGVTNASQAGNQGSTKNDGSSQNVTSTGADMANITYSVTAITPTNTVSDMIAPTIDTSGNVVSGGTGYTAGNIINITTNSDGIAQTGELANGYYLVQEITKVGGIYVTQPFIVNVSKNDTNVYPKLDLTPTNEIWNTAVTNGTDTITGTLDNVKGTPDNKDDDVAGHLTDIVNGTINTGDATNTNTAAAGDVVQWNLNATFDGSQVTNSDSNQALADGTNVSGSQIVGTYIINDSLPSGTTYKSGTDLVVNVVDSTGNIVATLPSSDYTFDGSTFSLTAQGQIDASNALGMGVTGTLNIQIPTIVTQSAVGPQVNSYTTTVVNSYGVDLSNNSAAKSTVNIGGINISKESGETGDYLSGAKFVLVKAPNLDSARNYVKANASSFDGNIPTAQVTPATDGAQLVLGSDGKTPISAASAGALNDVQFTGLDLSGSGMDSTFSKNGTSSYNGTLKADGNYYAVEVVAPQGYDLPNPSQGLNVFGSILADIDPSKDTNVIVNDKPFALPFTGGAGIGFVIAIAAVSGGLALIIRRRQNNSKDDVAK